MDPSPPSPSRRVIVIGDIHGCLTEFRRLIEKVDPKSKDRVVCVGDFMDKGSEPAACVQHARESGFEAVLSNHEEKHIRWRKHEDRRRLDPTYVNPVQNFGPRMAEQNQLLSEADLAWLASLPAYLRVAPGWVVVHGGVLPLVPIEKQAASDLIRTRWVHIETGKPKATDYSKPGDQPPNTVHWTELYNKTENVIFGHEAFSLSNPLVAWNGVGGTCFGIDTGCVHGGRLTAMVLDGGEPSFVQVQAERVYDKPGAPIPV